MKKYTSTYFYVNINCKEKYVFDELEFDAEVICYEEKISISNWCDCCIYNSWNNAILSI